MTSCKVCVYQRLIIFYTFAQHQFNQKQIKQAVGTSHRASRLLNQAKVFQYQNKCITQQEKKKKKRQLNHNLPQDYPIFKQLRLFSKYIEMKI